MALLKTINNISFYITHDVWIYLPGQSGISRQKLSYSTSSSVSCYYYYNNNTSFYYNFGSLIIIWVKQSSSNKVDWFFLFQYFVFPDNWQMCFMYWVLWFSYFNLNLNFISSIICKLKTVFQMCFITETPSELVHWYFITLLTFC